MGGVYNGDPEGREKAVATILAACKAAKKPCSFPVNNQAEFEMRKAQGFKSLLFQARTDQALQAINGYRK